MDKINQSLQQFGFTETEAKIYLTGIKYSSISVSELVKQTQINRTTIYHALETLAQKGLCARKQIIGRPARNHDNRGSVAGRQEFTMTEPTNIGNLLNEKIIELEKRKETLADILPLLTLAKQKTGRMAVSHYEGIDGIKLVVEDALYCKGGHWDIIAPVKNFFSEFDKTYANYFVETRKQRRLIARSLWEAALSPQNLTPEVLKERNPRILPKIMHGKFKSVICLYDDKVLVISSLGELYAVLIQSQEFFETMSAIFDGLWEGAVQVK